MSEPDPEAYYAAARELAYFSRDMEKTLRDLDTKLKVARSAGSYFSGGTKWAEGFDQAASDIFEVASTSAMAARELAYQVHQAGLNHAHAENDSHAGAPSQPTPAAPQGTRLQINLHPAERAVGGLHDTPDRWDLLKGYVQRPWADSDPDRIIQAGTDFGAFGKDRKLAAESLLTWATIKWDTAARADPEVAGIIDEIKNVQYVMREAGELASELEPACSQVGTVSKSNRDDIKTSLILLWAILLSYEADKIAAKRIPLVGDLLEEGIDQVIEATKKAYAKAIDDALKEISDTVDTAVTANCQSIYGLATSDVQLLSSILDRTPRQANPIRNRDDDDNEEAGAEGERRAGVPTNYKKRRVDVGNAWAFPDYIDDDNRQVVEVKNANQLSDRSVDQIKLETTWAQSQGYSMVLITDHRTKINNPDIQHLIDTGQIELVKMELDDNDDH